MKIVRSLLIFILIASALIFVYSLIMKEQFPRKEKIATELYQEPLQTETIAAPISQESNGVQYKLTPVYNYELYGLVLSDYKYDTKTSISPLRSVDVCVTWGKGIDSEIYNKTENESFPSYCLSRGETGMSAEDLETMSYSISNNHLYPANEEINKLMRSVKGGDQIYVKGYLINGQFSSPKGNYSFDTSTTRTDVYDGGAGTCESIYVTDFRVLHRYYLSRENLRGISLVSGIVALILLTILSFVAPERRVY